MFVQKVKFSNSVQKPSVRRHVRQDADVHDLRLRPLLQARPHRGGRGRQVDIRVHRYYQILVCKNFCPSIHAAASRIEHYGVNPNNKNHV